MAKIEDGMGNWDDRLNHEEWVYQEVMDYYDWFLEMYNDIIGYDWMDVITRNEYVK